MERNKVASCQPDWLERNKVASCQPDCNENRDVGDGFPQQDMSGFDLLEVEKQIYGSDILDLKYNTLDTYRLVDTYDNQGKCYSGIVVPNDDPECRLVANHLLSRGVHESQCSGIDNCDLRRIHFIGFDPSTDEMIYECKLHPFNTIVKHHSKGKNIANAFIDQAQDPLNISVDYMLHDYHLLQNEYQTCIKRECIQSGLSDKTFQSLTDKFIQGLNLSKHPSTYLIYFACTSRLLVCMIMRDNFLSDVRKLEWKLEWIHHVCCNSRAGGRINTVAYESLCQACKYTTPHEILSGAVPTVLISRVLSTELFVRFGGLKQLMQKLDWLSTHITDNPHDFDLWHSILRFAKNIRHNLVKKWSEYLDEEIKRCIRQWVHTSSAFMPGIMRFSVVQEDVIRMLVQSIMDGSHIQRTTDSDSAFEFIGRHCAPFHHFNKQIMTPDIFRTFGYADMSCRWIKSSALNPLYSSEARRIICTATDLLPDLLNIVYSYCNVL